MLRLARPDIPDAALDDIATILRSGMLVHGEFCDRFELRLADYLGVPHALVVSSGTAALHLSLLVLGIGHGDAVIVPDFTFPATANVVEMAGAHPLFVDVSPGSYNIDPQAVRRLCQDRAARNDIRAILPVHQFGNPCDMRELTAIAREFNLYVIEDAACAFGAVTDDGRAGTIGDTGCFSFHPRKMLTTGEGGLVVTGDADLAARLAMLRNHGIVAKSGVSRFETAGLNYRMTEVQAAIGLSQLDRYDETIDRRRRLKTIYDREFDACLEIAIPADGNGHIWQTYMVALAHGLPRDPIIERLRKEDIETNIGACSVLSQNAYARYRGDYEGHERWNSVALYQQGIALPLSETYSAEQIGAAAGVIRRVIEETRAA